MQLFLFLSSCYESYRKDLSIETGGSFHVQPSVAVAENGWRCVAAVRRASEKNVTSNKFWSGSSHVLCTRRRSLFVLLLDSRVDAGHPVSECIVLRCSQPLSKRAVPPISPRAAPAWTREQSYATWWRARPLLALSAVTSRPPSRPCAWRNCASNGWRHPLPPPSLGRSNTIWAWCSVTWIRCWSMWLSSKTVSPRSLMPGSATARTSSRRCRATSLK